MAAAPYVPQDCVSAAAASWLARRDGDDFSPADEQEFQAWLAADTAHGAAFAEAENIWEYSSLLGLDLRGVALRPAPRMDRRLALGGLTTLAAMGGTFAMTQMAQANVYKTGVGEQKRIHLPDGTGVFLDTDTRLVACFTSARRLVSLEYGQASFHVAADAKRPFAVMAANRTVVGTRSNFNVRCDGDKVQVVLLQGSASVEPPAGSREPVRTLGQGDRLAMAPAGARLDKPNLLPLLAWQTRQAIFQEENLADAVNEMNRYSKVKIHVSDARIAGFKVSGVYGVGNNAVFAHSLSRLLPVEAQVSSGGIMLVADAVRARKYEELISRHTL